MSERKKRQHYTQEFKLEAVKLAESVGITKAALELNVAKKSIQNWMSGISMGEASAKSRKRTVQELEAEIRRLKKENKNIKLINDVLKKSTAIFSKDQLGD